ncbi:MAG: hypothetical protein KDC99_19465, partial [Cyclobacteriaceae bacterium]|nr:hypothetical protein [Cyclobacteriaceae bacterium]
LALQTHVGLMPVHSTTPKELASNLGQQKKTIGRNTRTNDKLNLKIFKLIEAMRDKGTLGSLEKMYTNLSQQSERKLGVALTHGQVKGRYERYKNRRNRQ